MMTTYWFGWLAGFAVGLLVAIGLVIGMGLNGWQSFAAGFALPLLCATIGSIIGYRLS